MWVFGLLGIIFFSFAFYKIIKTEKYKEDKRLIPYGAIMILVSLAVFVFARGSTGKTIEMKDSTENVFSSKNTIIAGNVEYTVHSIDKKSKIKYSYGYKDQAYGKYVIFNIEIKNNFQFPLKMNVSEYKGTNFILKNEDFFYTLNRDVSYDLTDEKYNNGSYIHDYINPGVAMLAEIVFDVPEEIASSKDLELIILTDDSAPSDIYIPVN